MLAFTSRKPLSDAEPFQAGAYLLLTAGAFQKLPFIRGDDRKSMLQESLDFNCYKWGWRLLAYVILDNHYHLVVQTPGGDASHIAHIIQSAHSFTAHHWRQADPSIRSRIWWNFWDSPITDPPSLRTLINYLHDNPRFHHLTPSPATYPFSSYADYLQRDSELVRRWEEAYPAAAARIIDGF